VELELEAADRSGFAHGRDVAVRLSSPSHSRARDRRLRRLNRPGPTMLLRHSLLYALGRGLPGIVNFLAIAVYTRLLAPEVVLQRECDPLGHRVG
jgi:hypothetical protein